MLRSHSRVIWLALSVVAWAGGCGWALLTPDQAKAAAALIFHVDTTTISDLCLESAVVPPDRAYYSMSLPGASGVTVDALDGQLRTCLIDDVPKESTFALTPEQVEQAARAFCSSLGVSIPPNYTMDGVPAHGGVPEDCAYDVDFLERQGDIRLLGSISVEVSSVTGLGVHLSQTRPAPVTISLSEPYLTPQAAKATATAWLAANLPNEPAVLGEAVPRVLAVPELPEQQKLVQAVAVELTDHSTPDFPDRGEVWVDARTNEVFGVLLAAGAMSGETPKRLAPRMPGGQPGPRSRGPQGTSLPVRFYRDHAQALVSLGWTARQDLLGK